jgi:uncharacterized protein YjdB
MLVGETATLSANVLPANATDKSVTWQTDDSGIVSVNESGRIVAKAPGRTTITVTSKDDEDVKATCVVTVVPKKATLSKVKNIAKKKMKITWRKQNDISGYQIQYSTNSNLKKAKAKRVYSNYNGLAVGNLKKKKTYYVRVRAYKNEDGGTIYGAWSNVKKVKIKK